MGTGRHVQIGTASILTANAPVPTLTYVGAFSGTGHTTFPTSTRRRRSSTDGHWTACSDRNSFNPHGERASSNFDVRRRFQWYWTYNLPNFDKAQKILNGWALDGMFRSEQLQSSRRTRQFQL